MYTFTKMPMKRHWEWEPHLAGFASTFAQGGELHFVHHADKEAADTLPLRHWNQRFYLLPGAGHQYQATHCFINNSSAI